MNSIGPENSGHLHNRFALFLLYPSIPSRLPSISPCFFRTDFLCRSSLSQIQRRTDGQSPLLQDRGAGHRRPRVFVAQ